MNIAPDVNRYRREAALEGDARNLANLLDVVCDLKFDCDPEENRIDSLLWIARDLAEQLAERLEPRL
jgi:hypothetical protein